MVQGQIQEQIQGQDLFLAIAESDELIGRFFNMLSMMEYIGASKIAKSQSLTETNADTMSHLTEEIRHAQVFKKLALKCNPLLDGFSDETVLAFSAAKNYMHSIDQGIADQLNIIKTRKNYVLTTLVVEERAKKVYPLFSKIFDKYGASGPIRAILREEEGHLSEVQEEIKSLGVSEDLLSQFRKIEEDAFQAILQAMEKEVSALMKAVSKAPGSQSLGELRA